MLPQRIVAVRVIGDTASPYWAAASPDGVHLLLEPGERVLHVSGCRISQTSPEKWSLPDPAGLVVTDRRTAFLTTQFDQGGGWTGFGVAGLAVAVTANAVSKHKAAKRSAGKVAVGHVRHEWITGITLRRFKALIGSVDTYIDLSVATAAGIRNIELWGPRIISEDFARWLAGTVAIHRTGLLGPEAAQDIAMMERYRQGGHEPAHTGNRPGLAWRYPGDTDALIAAVMATTLVTPAPAAPAAHDEDNRQRQPGGVTNG